MPIRRIHSLYIACRLRSSSRLILAAVPGTARADDKALIVQGEYLARAGDCIACHTNPGDALFAGGRAMPTPFGTIYSSNITPDMETGIGSMDRR